MANYLRQLQNDEKRCPSAIVATVTGNDLVGPLAVANLGLSMIPENSTIGKIYAVVTEAFAAGSTIDFGVSGALTDFLTALDLATVAVTRSAKDHGTVYEVDTTTLITPNANALASTTGEVKLVIELVETDLRAGKYSA